MSETTTKARASPGSGRREGKTMIGFVGGAIVGAYAYLAGVSCAAVQN